MKLKWELWAIDHGPSHHLDRRLMCRFLHAGDAEYVSLILNRELNPSLVFKVVKRK